MVRLYTLFHIAADGAGDLEPRLAWMGLFGTRCSDHGLDTAQSSPLSGARFNQKLGITRCDGRKSLAQPKDDTNPRSPCRLGNALIRPKRAWLAADDLGLMEPVCTLDLTGPRDLYDRKDMVSGPNGVAL